MKYIKKIIIILCIVFISSVFCNAEEEVKLAWDPSVSDIEGYRIYRTATEGNYIFYSDTFDGWQPGIEYIIGDKVTELGTHYICNTNHTSSVFMDDMVNWDVLPNNMVWEGPELTCTLPVDHPENYYVATCYNSKGQESGRSNEVLYIAQFVQPLNIRLTDMTEDNFDECIDRRVVDQPFTVCWDPCENALGYELKIVYYFYEGLETGVVTTTDVCYTFDNLPKSSRHFEVKIRATYSETTGNWGSSSDNGNPKNWLIYSKPAMPGW